MTKSDLDRSVSNVFLNFFPVRLHFIECINVLHTGHISTRSPNGEKRIIIYSLEMFF